MNTIGKHINELIILHDCVIVPGLGGFVANYKPASISEEKGLFLPPLKEIGFNRSLMHNDGLLYNHVALMCGVVYSEAQKLVETFVLQVMGELASGNPVEIVNLGHLKRDTLGNILFIANPNGVVMPDAFGLSAVHLSINEVIADKNQMIDASRSFTLPRIPHKQVAAGIAIVAGLFLLTPSVNKSSGVSQASFTSLPDINLMAPEVVNEEAVQTDTLMVVIPEEVSTVIEEEVNPVVQEDNAPAWFLIAASFPDASPAQLHCENLKKNGYANSRVVVIDGKNRVAVDIFNHRADALQAMNQYRTIKGFESVWLLRNKEN